MQPNSHEFVSAAGSSSPGNTFLKFTFSGWSGVVSLLLQRTKSDQPGKCVGIENTESEDKIQAEVYDNERKLRRKGRSDWIFMNLYINNFNL